MDRQKVFDKVANHLLLQSCRATNGQGGCMYRGQNNMSCAVGCLIPEDKYDKRMEGLSVSDVMARTSGADADDELSDAHFLRRVLAEELKIETNADFLFLSELQSIHDNADVARWKPSLELFAKHKGLEFNHG